MVALTIFHLVASNGCCGSRLICSHRGVLVEVVVLPGHSPRIRAMVGHSFHGESEADLTHLNILNASTCDWKAADWKKTQLFHHKWSNGKKTAGWCPPWNAGRHLTSLDLSTSLLGCRSMPTKSPLPRPWCDLFPHSPLVHHPGWGPIVSLSWLFPTPSNEKYIHIQSIGC